ncbi:MAG: hypothetical protein K2Q27_05330 [Novosphingobium sp.]|nr:hypothetical protein [Novosphingobium sp.]
MATITPFTAAEKVAIDRAFLAIRDLCGCTTWAEGPLFSDALKTIRKGRGITNQTFLRAVTVEAWHKGLLRPDRTLKALWGLSSDTWTLMALGAKHSDQIEDSYLGPKVANCKALASAAREAKDAQFQRALDEIDNR